MLRENGVGRLSKLLIQGQHFQWLNCFEASVFRVSPATRRVSLADTTQALSKVDHKFGMLAGGDRIFAGVEIDNRATEVKGPSSFSFSYTTHEQVL